MKNELLATVLFVFGLYCPLGLARGVDSSGGGDDLVAEFIVLSHELIGSYGDQWPKYRDTLQKALDTVKVVSTPVLKDPKTGVAIPNQTDLVAWGSPGLIQLKENIPGQSSWADLLARNATVAQYIFHELYRASGIVGPDGRSPDDRFQISIGELHLNNLPLTESLPNGGGLLVNDTATYSGNFQIQVSKDGNFTFHAYLLGREFEVSGPLDSCLFGFPANALFECYAGGRNMTITDRRKSPTPRVSEVRGLRIQGYEQTTHDLAGTRTEKVVHISLLDDDDEDEIDAQLQF